MTDYGVVACAWRIRDRKCSLDRSNWLRGGGRCCSSVVVLVGLILGSSCIAPGPGSGPAGNNDANGGRPDGGVNQDGGLDPDVAPITEGEWLRLGADATWQWQIQPGETGQINTIYDVDVYDVDLFDVDDAVIQQLHDDGRQVVCYFSAGSFENFRDDADQFAEADLGMTLEGFADERWLDIRSVNVHRIMRDRIALAAARGCDGVEPDNVTGFQNATGFDLSASDQLAFNRFIANEAHTLGLAVGLKNDQEQIDELIAYFDFAVNEECHEFEECGPYDAFIDAGKPVFNAEYAASFINDADARQAMCGDAREQGLRTLVLPLDLDDSIRFSCDE